MKAVVIGASGLVGCHLMRVGRQRGWHAVGTYHKFAQPGLIPLQLINAYGVRSLLAESRPNLVFLPAFRSSVDYCEQNPDETYHINVAGSLNVVTVAAEIGAKLIFYSSDYIFDGTAGPYRETDKPNPICIYGQQKLEVEQAISQLMQDYLILRITVVYGWENQKKNFVYRVLETLEGKQLLKVPHDQVGSPTLVDDIAEASCRLVEAGAVGVFHIAGPDRMSRYQLGVEAARAFGLPAEYIIPVTTAELGQAAPRPLEAGMVCDRLVNTLNWNLHGVLDGLAHFKQTQDMHSRSS